MTKNKGDLITLRNFVALSLFNVGLLIVSIHLNELGFTLNNVLFVIFIFFIQLLTSSFANGTQHSLTHCPLFNSYFLTQIISFINAVLNSKNPPFLWNVHHSMMHHISNNGIHDVSRVHKGFRKRHSLSLYIPRFVIDAVPIFITVIKRFKESPELKDSPFLDKRDLKYLKIMPILLLPYLLVIAAVTYLYPLCGIVYLVGMLANLIELAGLNYLQHAWDENTEEDFASDYTKEKQVMLSSATIIGEWYNRNHGNTGLHSIHHIYPTTHWTEYPGLTIKHLEKAQEKGYGDKLIILTTDLPSIIFVLYYYIYGPRGILKKYRIKAEEAIEILSAREG